MDMLKTFSLLSVCIHKIYDTRIDSDVLNILKGNNPISFKKKKKIAEMLLYRCFEGKAMVFTKAISENKTRNYIYTTLSKICLA